jgi:hypothetical protein
LPFIKRGPAQQGKNKLFAKRRSSFARMLKIPAAKAALARAADAP